MGEHQPMRESLELSPMQHDAWVGFLRAHKEIIKRISSELERSHSMTLSCFDVLAQLNVAPDRQLRMSDLADAVLLSQSGLTRLVERLEREGLVERRPCGTDARSVMTVLTDRGFEKFATLSDTHLAGVRHMFLDRLSEEQMEDLAAIWRCLLETR